MFSKYQIPIMNNFKNNQRRNRFRSNGDRSFKKRNVNGHKLNGDFNNNSEFRRRNPGRNNQNAAKLIEKYNELAREALSNGDKILSENYFQHADHFTRVLNERENFKKERFAENVNENGQDVFNPQNNVSETNSGGVSEKTSDKLEVEKSNNPEVEELINS